MGDASTTADPDKRLSHFMSNISEIKSVKNNSDIIKIISHFVDIRKDGVNFTGKCPFHLEKSKSFVVNSQRQKYKCFGCGAAGDAIDFVIKYKSFSYKKALEWIADFENITIDKDYSFDAYIDPEPSFLSSQLLAKSLKSNSKNNFSIWLKSITDLPHEYIISTSNKKWFGSVIFWYIDIDNQVRSGKIMQYDPNNGKRVKEPYPLVTWVHKVLKLQNFNLNVCLFGEYLLNKYPNKTVAIVESEKTAILASACYPNLIWLASGSLSYLNFKRCQVLKGRNVILYPDVGAEPKWIEKKDQLNELMPDTKFEVRTLVGNYQKGYDLCDYILDNKLYERN